MNYKINKIKKAQGALEFLTTYAWAFLVILILIGALAYFGILRPTKLLPERCIFGPEIGCQYYKLTWGAVGTDGGATLQLKNNVGEHITTISVAMKTEEGTELCTTSIGEWNAEEVKSDVTFSNCDFKNNGLVQNEKGKVFITIEYHPTKAGTTYSKVVKGEVYATVQ